METIEELDSSKRLSKLCASCQEVDFQRYAWRILEAAEESSVAKQSLGSIQSIRERSIDCAFCRLVTCRLDAHSKEHQPDDECIIGPTKKGSFSTVVDEKKGAKQLEVSYIYVQVVPAQFSGFFGPVLPSDFYVPEARISLGPEENSPYELMLLQPCIQPTPHVDLFCAQPLDQLTRVEDMRFSGRLRRDTLDLRLPLRWLHLCRRHHVHEQRSLCEASLQESLVELRVIDVMEMSVDYAPASCEYVALSYCWGRGRNVVCTIANKHALAKPQSLKKLQLPATIQDAIEVTRATGVRYIWVDALCNIQDDPIALDKQLRQMNLIYRYSVYTIIAAGGDHADSGLPGVRPNSRRVDTDAIVLNDITFIPTSPPSAGLGTMDSVWRTRAWTMQEETFSIRKLYFSPDRISWLCQKACWTEHEALETFSSNASSPSYVGKARDGSGYTPPSLSASDFTLKPREFELLMQEIFSRQMSYATDSLNAFSGILKEVFVKHGKELLWGHPKIWFSKSLQWNSDFIEKQHHAAHREVHQEKVVDVKFPSWSWTAWAKSYDDSSIWWSTGSELEDWANPGPIRFYQVSVDGVLRPVIQNETHHLESHQQHIEQYTPQHEDWMGPKSPNPPGPIAAKLNSVPDRDFGIDSGLLVCWTSVAHIYVQRTRLPVQRRPHLYRGVNRDFETISHSVNMQNTAHLTWSEVSRTLVSIPGTGSRFEDDPGEFLGLDAIVIGMPVYHGDEGRILQTLIVEWIDGVAYRRGYSSISERKWVQLDREWRLVTLG